MNSKGLPSGLEESAAMAKPHLFLNIEQGPKSGCRLGCEPTSTVTIGRTRANTLQISKDFGISQKHVCFQWRDDVGYAGWMAMDMGSSNGTIIDDQQAAPHEWICLQDGALIKIGAETSIRVEIGDEDELQTAPKAKERSKARMTRSAAERHGRGTAKGGDDRVASALNDVKHEVVESADDELQKIPDKSLMKSTCAAAESHEKDVAGEEDVRLASTSNELKHEKKRIDTTADVDLNMTVEQWFQHMMEEGPKYLHQVAEATIQDILTESGQFDEYVASLGC